MENKYKEFAVDLLYGLIIGSPKSLEGLLNEQFKFRFEHEPDSIKVTSTNRIVEDDGNFKGSWIGTMTVTLLVNGEEYIITRDWGEEYDNDKTHPNFETDDWFYDGEDCFSWKKSQEILKSIHY